MVQRSAFCRSRRELSNAYLFTKIWLRYSRERALSSLHGLRVQIPQVQQQRVPVRGLAGAGRLEVPGLSGREERQTRLLPLAKRRHAERLVNLCVNAGFPPCCGSAQQT